MLAEGDSITFGSQATDGAGSYVPRACLPRLHRLRVVVAAKPQAVLGSAADPPGANSLYGRIATDDRDLAAAKTAGRVAVLSILIGRNDLVGYGGGPEAYAADLARYIAAMRRAGWDRVILGTLLPSNWPLFQPPRAHLNAIITAPGWAAAHGVDAIADFGASPDMGSSAAAEGKTYFADGIHPNNRGYGTMAVIFDAALRRVISRGN